VNDSWNKWVIVVTVKEWRSGGQQWSRDRESDEPGGEW